MPNVAVMPVRRLELPAEGSGRARNVVVLAGAGVTLDTEVVGDTVTLTISADGGSGTPASSVVSETFFGAAPAVGVSTNYARQDHTHGSPAAPTAASVGAIASSVLTTDEDILIRRGGVPARLAVGAEGTIPKVIGGIIVWTTLSFTMALDQEVHMPPVLVQGSPARTT